MSAATPPGTPSEEPVAKLIEIAKPTIGQRLISWASRPPGRLYLPACAAVALVLVYSISMPGWHLLSLLFGVLAGGFLAAMGALRLGIALTVARPMIRYYWLRWITAPLIVLALVLLTVTDLPLQMRVNASEGAMVEVGENLNPSTTIPLDGQRAGLFTLESGTVHDDGTVRFAVQGAGFLRDSGLAYTTSELPTGVFIPGHGNVTYSHLSGPWYVWFSH